MFGSNRRPGAARSAEVQRALGVGVLMMVALLAVGAAPSLADAQAQPGGTRFVESALSLADPRPCIPEAGQRACDATRNALWNGEAAAWAARGVTNPDARFNETVVFRVRAGDGDPAAIGNIARFLEAPYLQITRLAYGEPGNEFIEITNLGGGAQTMTGWTVRSPGRGAVNPPFPAGSFAAFTQGFVMGPAQSCRVYSEGVRADSCATTMFNNADAWPDEGGEAVLYFDALDLLGDRTLYSADPNNQPPAPNLQGSRRGSEPEPPAGMLTFALSTSKATYAMGEPVEFRMVARNQSSAPRTLNFPSGQDFDITVRDAAGRPVWTFSTGQAFTQVFRMVTLAPNEERAFTATWDQRSDAGTPVSGGAYTATATLSTTEPVQSNPVDFRIEAPQPGEGLVFTLNTSKGSYAAGEPVEFRMVLENRGSTPRMLPFNSGQDFDITVRNEGGQAVWQFSTSRSFTQVVREVTLAPGEQRTFTATWDQRSDAGTLVGAGAYSATAVLTASERLNSSPVSFRIESTVIPQPGALSFALSTSKPVYDQGEPVVFRMVLRNDGSQARMVTFPSGQDFDITVRSQAGAEVWRFSTGRGFTQAVREVVLQPGEVRTFTATWDQRGDNGMAVAAGSYTATALLTAAGEDRINSDPVTFRIGG